MERVNKALTFTSVDEAAVISVVVKETIYRVPRLHTSEELDIILCDKLKINKKRKKMKMGKGFESNGLKRNGSVNVTKSEIRRFNRCLQESHQRNEHMPASSKEIPSLYT